MKLKLAAVGEIMKEKRELPEQQMPQAPEGSVAKDALPTGDKDKTASCLPARPAGGPPACPADRWSPDDLPKRCRKMYDEGIIPPLHNAYFKALRKLLNGADAGVISVTEAMRNAHISVTAQQSAMKGLIAYGYIEARTAYREKSEGLGPGRSGTYIKILRPEDEE